MAIKSEKDMKNIQHNDFRHFLAVCLLAVLAWQTGAAQQRDTLVLLPWGETVPADRTSVSSAIVTGTQLERTPYRDAFTGLTGLIPGMEQTMGGNCSVSFGSKALATTSCVIDDVPLDYYVVNLEANQIESISFLSSTVEKAKYGPYATSGVLYIRTKKGGYDTPFTIHAFAESGVGHADWRAEYAGAVDYARLNNQARAAAGYTQLYSEEAIAGFAKGDPLDRRYPAVDWKSLLIKDWRPTTRAGIEAFGGTRNIKYHFALNGLADGDFYKIGPDTFSDRVNLTTSITARIDRYITAGASFRGMLAYHQEGRGGLYGYTAAYPVAFPVAFGLSTGTTDLDGDRLGMPVYAVSRTCPTNPYAYAMEGGFTLTRNRTGIFDAHIDVDMDWLLKGLTLQGVVNLATQYSLASGKNEDYLAYYWDATSDITDLSTHQGVKSSSKSVFSTSTYQNLSTFAKAAYKREFGDHALDMHVVGYLSEMAQSSLSYPSRFVSLIGSLSYVWKQRYILDLTANRSGSSQYAREGRYGTFPAAGLAWIASKEPLLREARWLDYLKVYAQGGLLAMYSPTGSNFLYEGSYLLGSSLTYGPAPVGQWFGIDTQSASTTEISRLPNRGLTYPLFHQYEAGFDLDFSCGLGLSANIYQIERTGYVANLMSLYPSLYGYGSAVWYDNYTETLIRGASLTLRYNRHLGEVRIGSALNLMSWDSWSTKLVLDEYIYPWQRQTGRSTADYVGYVYAGKFETGEQIETLPKYDQTGTQVGDLRYEDLNGDGVIDANDQRVIGYVIPKLRFNWVVDLSWKGWELNLTGLGQSSRDVYLTGTYFRGGSGDGNYSAFIRDNIGGAYPRLSYIASATNGLDSNFWRRKCWFLKLRNVELAYNIPCRRFGVNNVRVSLKGADLLTLTNLKEADPESLTSGLSAYPFTQYVSLGAKLSF